MNHQRAKPYLQTSYFWIMVASWLLGPLFLWFVAWLVPQLPLTEAQRAQLFVTSFNGWLSIVAITTGGNVAARGSVTFLKYLQPVLEALASQRDAGSRNQDEGGQGRDAGSMNQDEGGLGRDAGYKMQDAGSETAHDDTSSAVTDHSSLSPHSSSLYTHPSSLSPHPSPFLEVSRG